MTNAHIARFVESNFLPLSVDITAGLVSLQSAKCLFVNVFSEDVEKYSAALAPRSESWPGKPASFYLVERVILLLGLF
jgi:hypothetical protein